LKTKASFRGLSDGKTSSFTFTAQYYAEEEIWGPISQQWAIANFDTDSNGHYGTLMFLKDTYFDAKFCDDFSELMTTIMFERKEKRTPDDSIETRLLWIPVFDLVIEQERIHISDDNILTKWHQGQLASMQKTMRNAIDAGFFM